MRRVASIALAVALGSAAVIAQPPKPPKPTPGPEHKRIAYFAGQWSYQGEAKDSPMGPGGKITATETCEWFAGGFQLVCRTKGTGPRGPVTGMSAMSFDPSRKAYTYFGMTSLGENIFVRGQVQDKTWTWTDEATMDGKKVKFVATVVEESPTSTSFKLEASVEGGPMTVIEQGKSTKGKAT
ncbi:MAG TPA: DUF1579 family protein [Vicinamibacterales bacterium]|jgi:hypothetical protein